MKDLLKAVVLKFNFFSQYFNVVSTVKSANELYIKCILSLQNKFNLNHEESKFLVENLGQEVLTRKFYRSEIYYVRALNIKLLVNSGFVIKDNSILTESGFDEIRIKASPYFQKPEILKEIRFESPCTSIIHKPWGRSNIYHWFIDCLPRLFFLVDFPTPITILANRSMPDYQHEVLEHFISDLPNVSIQLIEDNMAVSCSEFYLPSFPAFHNSGYIPLEILDFIKRSVIRGYKLESPPFKKRLFISRSKASKRRVINENELYPTLTKLGFEIIYSEDLTYRDQVAIFLSAEIVIAGHGAGLTNLIFSTDAKIVELFPKDNVKTHYMMLAKALGFEYLPILGSNQNSNQDFEIDIKSFSNSVEEFIMTK